MSKKKPLKCCYPNCFECPYVECRYDRLEVEDYTETNKRDYELYEGDTGRKLHKDSEKDYRQGRQNAYNRRNSKSRDRKEYNKQYYQKNKEKIKEKNAENYNTKRNTIKCRKYRKKNKKKRTEYEKKYYELHKEEKKRKARERYYRLKIAN